MVKSMFLGLISVVVGTAGGGAAMAQARLAVSTDVVQSTSGMPTTPIRGPWSACVADYIRDHSAQIQDPDDAADKAFDACRALQRSLKAVGEQPLVYVRASNDHPAAQYSVLTQKTGLVESARADPH